MKDDLFDKILNQKNQHKTCKVDKKVILNARKTPDENQRRRLDQQISRNQQIERNSTQGSIGDEDDDEAYYDENDDVEYALPKAAEVVKRKATFSKQ